MIRRVRDSLVRLVKGAIAGVILACVLITAWQSTLWARHEHDAALAIPGAIVVAAFAWSLLSTAWNRAVGRAAGKLVAKGDHRADAPVDDTSAKAAY